MFQMRNQYDKRALEKRNAMEDIFHEVFDSMERLGQGEGKNHRESSYV